MEWKKMETRISIATKTDRKRQIQRKHCMRFPVIIALPNQTAGGYIFSRIPMTIVDNSLSISGVMLSSIKESMEEP